MADLEEQLKKAQEQRFRIIVTDGVFSMDGNVAPMDQICALAEKYDAMVMVDECHSAGVVGATGRGVSEKFNLRGQIDIITGTLGKAFGGGVGGFTTGRKEIIDLLRQRSRPYLFSNSIPPAVVGASLEMFKMLEESDELHDKLVANVEHFRTKMLAAGFDIKPTQSAICAVMLYDAKLSQDMAAKLLATLYRKNFEFKISQRRKGFVVYTRNSETIEDFLATIGAQSTCLEIMSNKVVKDIRNRVNRIRNCETANIAKAAKATSEHIEAIETLMANGKFEFLSDDLKYIAELKMENPELSLSELAAITNPPMTKSSLNRRLKKFCDMAKQEETNEQ
jgi:hypothetical protein